MTNLKNAPLIYVLGMVRFPRVPSIERFTNEFLDKIRHEYPIEDDINVPVIKAVYDQGSLQITQQESRLWQFSTVDRTWGFILTDQSLCLHTASYYDFVDFSRRFQKGLNILLDIPEISIEWTTAIGIRYVDLVVTRNGEKLNQYLQSWVLPADPDEESMLILEGAHIVRYKTITGELRLQVLCNPPLTLPSELQSPFMAKNGWIKNRPNTEFALLDFDHNLTFTTATKMTPTDVINHLVNLKQTASTVFKSVSTDFACNIWKG